MTIKKLHLVVYTLLFLICPSLHGKKSIQKLSRLELEFVIAKQFCKKYRRELEISAALSLISIASWADRRLEAYYSNLENERYEETIKTLREKLITAEKTYKDSKIKLQNLKKPIEENLSTIKSIENSPTICIRNAKQNIAKIRNSRSKGSEIKIRANEELIKFNEAEIEKRIVEAKQESFNTQLELKAKESEYLVHKNIQNDKYYNSFRYPIELTIMGINVFDLLNLANEYRRFRSQFIDALEKGGNLSL